MPREQLLGLAADVDRLLAAGATAAAGNETLSRRGRALRELGQKVPALVPVADAVERVTSSSSRQVGRAFLDLVVMARQLRGSLAGAGVEGALQAVDASGPWQTPTPTRDVYDAHEALIGEASSAELEDAAERKVAGDLRLLPSALAALEKSSGTLADVVADKVLPAIGRAVLPDLLARFDPKGKAGDARRLRALCKIDPKIGLDLCRKALAEGSPVLKVQALECLPDVAPAEEAEQAGLRMFKEKKKDIKLAALSALRTATGEEALDLLLEALPSDDFDTTSRVMEVLTALPHPQATERLLRQVEERTASLPPPVPQPKKGARKKAREAAEKAEAERDEIVEHLRRFVAVFAGRKDAPRPLLLKTLLSLAHHEERVIRHGVVEHLGKLAAEAKEAMTALLEAMDDADPEVAEAAVDALGELPAAKREKAIPVLLERAADRKAHQVIVVAILHMLPQHMNRHGDEILDLLRMLLKGKNDYVRSNVLSALAEIGPPAHELLPDLLKQIKAGSGGLSCTEVFVKLEPEGTTSIPTLIELLRHKKSQSRSYALEGLTGYGPKAAAAEPLATKLLKDRVWLVKYNAARALAAFKGEG